MSSIGRIGSTNLMFCTISIVVDATGKVAAQRDESGMTVAAMRPFSERLRGMYAMKRAEIADRNVSAAYTVVTITGWKTARPGAAGDVQGGRDEGGRTDDKVVKSAGQRGAQREREGAGVAGPAPSIMDAGARSTRNICTQRGAGAAGRASGVRSRRADAG